MAPGWPTRETGGLEGQLRSENNLKSRGKTYDQSVLIEASPPTIHCVSNDTHMMDENKTHENDRREKAEKG